jgi:formylglycine-generating enzyme required for sulfatase activity
MAGNLWELVQDRAGDNYEGAPDDGSAFEPAEALYRVMRGGGFASDNSLDHLHVSNRIGAGREDDAGAEWGFRCAR